MLLSEYYECHYVTAESISDSIKLTSFTTSSSHSSTTGKRDIVITNGVPVDDVFPLTQLSSGNSTNSS